MDAQRASGYHEQATKIPGEQVSKKKKKKKNVNKEIENTKRIQIEILELKNTITGMSDKETDAERVRITYLVGDRARIGLCADSMVSPTCLLTTEEPSGHQASSVPFTCTAQPLSRMFTLWKNPLLKPLPCKWQWKNHPSKEF